MMQRIGILTTYFAKGLFFSLTGLILLILSLIYWAVLFPPGQGTPDVENYVILVGALGAATTFMAALAISARAGRMENYPLLVRLPSRIEYLVAVFLSALVIGLVLQLLVAGLALIRGPELTKAHLLAIPPLWISVNILAGILALHASDLVTAGWSRVVIFGLLAALLLLRGIAASPDSWLADRMIGLSDILYRLNLTGLADLAAEAAGWSGGAVLASLSRVSGLVFWPFRAMSDAVFAGGFTPLQALAPAVLLLYSAILFLTAALFFAGKDLEFVE
jgi:hypothetical protein